MGERRGRPEGACGERRRGQAPCGRAQADVREDREDEAGRARVPGEGLAIDGGREVDAAVVEPHEPAVARAADGHHEFPAGQGRGVGRERGAEPDAAAGDRLTGGGRGIPRRGYCIASVDPHASGQSGRQQHVVGREHAWAGRVVRGPQRDRDHRRAAGRAASIDRRDERVRQPVTARRHRVRDDRGVERLPRQHSAPGKRQEHGAARVGQPHRLEGQGAERQGRRRSRLHTEQAQFRDRRHGQAAATDLPPRHGAAIDQEHPQAAGGEPSRRRRTGRPGTDHDHLPHRAGGLIGRQRRRTGGCGAGRGIHARRPPGSSGSRVHRISTRSGQMRRMVALCRPASAHRPWYSAVVRPLARRAVRRRGPPATWTAASSPGRRASGRRGCGSGPTRPRPDGPTRPCPGAAASPARQRNDGETAMRRRRRRGAAGRDHVAHLERHVDAAAGGQLPAALHRPGAIVHSEDPHRADRARAGHPAQPSRQGDRHVAPAAADVDHGQGEPRRASDAASIRPTARARWTDVRDTALIVARLPRAWRWSASAIAGSSMSSGCRDGGIDQGITRSPCPEAAGATSGRRNPLQYRCLLPNERTQGHARAAGHPGLLREMHLSVDDARALISAGRVSAGLRVARTSGADVGRRAGTGHFFSGHPSESPARGPLAPLVVF